MRRARVDCESGTLADEGPKVYAIVRRPRGRGGTRRASQGNVRAVHAEEPESTLRPLHDSPVAASV